MAEYLSVRCIVEALHKRLGLGWLAGRSGQTRRIRAQSNDPGSRSLVGHLNLIHPNQIQVLGNAELHYLNTLRKHSRHDVLEQLFCNQTVMLIICDDQCPSHGLVTLADKTHLPLLQSALPSHELISCLRYFFSNRLAETTVVHGVFMEVIGAGLLITGQSGIGKSELALELISRGHRLVADDAPNFARITPETLRGSCPHILEDFLEVRGLGVLNIRALFGDSAIKSSKYLHLIIDLCAQDQLTVDALDRLNGICYTRTILGLDIPVIALPVAPGRNLAVMVETAVRNHLLRMKGYYAGDDLAARQRRAMQA
ncbi:HPr(Ser) kinase/phosphatase [Thiorhodospira sibirica]|uniref:HPr(Ser) kinase/phosphatase n=1 Tax=Thiorhodospira sibirica TaxID=154347 RepID=UPI00022C585A|nr:HPr(Ser) kinase/phosphatase [Thiorhodospira sibirica]